MSQYTFQLVQSRTAHLAYLRLRRAIFCEEQKLFRASDEDAWDRAAYPIVATTGAGFNVGRDSAFAGPCFNVGRDSAFAGPSEHVVGVVRIYEAEPGTWYGGRLGVDPEHRKRGVVGRGLVYKAVTVAHGWGCRRFLALVLEPNVPFFADLGWRSLGARMHCDRVHHLMEADLAHYPPGGDPRPAASSAWP